MCLPVNGRSRTPQRGVPTYICVAKRSWMRRPNPNLCLGASHIRTSPRIDLHQLTFLDEQWDIHRLAGLKNCGLGDIRRRITAEAFWSFHDLELHRSGQLDLDRTSSGRENFDSQVFDEILLRS